MVRPTNPKLMHKVMDAVVHLGENKGSSVRDILQLVKKGSNGPNRNLTMQVQRALKHAVTAGILRYSNSRYKPTIALHQVSQAPRRRRTEDEYKIVEEMPDVDESTTGGVDPFGAVEDRRKRRRSSRKRRGSRRRRGRSGRRRRGRRHANEEYEDMGPTDRKKMGLKSRAREDESVEHRVHKNRNSDKYSDISGSEHESRNRSRKPNLEHSHASRRSTSRSRPREEVSEKNNNRRSSSRHRSQPRNSQAPIDDSDAPNAMDCEDDVHDNEHHDTCETKNCESDCSIH